MKAHKIAELFPMLGETEINELANDIKENGLMVPIITYEDCILDGRNRYAACKIAEVEPVMKEYEGESPLEYVLSLNLHRRHLDATQKAVLGVRMLPIVEEEARKKEVEVKKGNKNAQKTPEPKLAHVFLKTTEAILPQAEINIESAQKTIVPKLAPLFSKNDNKRDKQSRDKVAAIVGVGRSYISDVKKITEEHPQYTEQMFRGDITLQEVKKEIKLLNRKNTISDIEKKIEEENLVCNDKFDVISIDPPWDYTEKNGSDIDGYDPNGRRIVQPYPSMTLEDISDIELPAKDNCVLFLWTTQAFLRDSFELLDKWGFTYKATIVWDKEKMGMGSNIRIQCEFCLLAVKGTPTIQGSATRDIIRESRREHSRKPEAFYKMVEDITIGSKCDYFSRNKRDGWVSIGVEKGKYEEK